MITGDAMIGWTPYMGDGYPEDWAGTLDRLAQLDFTHIIMGHGDVTGREWLNAFRSYVYDMVEAVRQEVATGATLDEVKQRVIAKLAPRHEKPFSAYDDYRPWRTGVAANIERTFAMVSYGRQDFLRRKIRTSSPGQPGRLADDFVAEPLVERAAPDSCACRGASGGSRGAAPPLRRARAGASRGRDRDASRGPRSPARSRSRPRSSRAGPPRSCRHRRARRSPATGRRRRRSRPR